MASLTAQEQKILLLVAEGKTNRQIAADVFLSDKTVKNYVSSILSKLDLQRRAQAAAFVARRRPPGGPGISRLERPGVPPAAAPMPAPRTCPGSRPSGRTSGGAPPLGRRSRP